MIKPALPRRAAGFTLIELIVTIAIAGILVAIAAPSFRTLTMSNRMAATSNGLFNALNYARNAALSTNAQVQVCPYLDGSTSCGTNWAAGWIVTGTVSGTSRVLQATNLAANAPTLSSPSSTASVTFDPRGITSTGAQFQFCDSRGSSEARTVRTIPTGFVQAAQGATPVWGGSVSCS